MADLAFQIDGVRYELPSLLGLTNRENRIYHKATGLLTEWSWVGLQTGETTFAELMQNEGFLPAMAHIAYIREHPDADDAQVAEMIDRVNRFELFSSLVDSTLSEEEDAAPLEDTTSGPSGSSKSSSDGKRSTSSSKAKRSGKRSRKSSDQQDGSPASTGTSESDGRSTSAQLRRVI